jgi:glutathione S-transferase
MTELPVLYSFRRCPYAMRARMSLAAAGIPVRLREVLLKDKPPALFEASAKATVPVLVLGDGTVLEESLEIMEWALEQNDPLHWAVNPIASSDWIASCDGEFKYWLDRYKYADRYPEHTAEQYRNSAESFIQRLESTLTTSAWVAGPQPTIADIALFPFVRQFAAVDAAWWQVTPYAMTRRWLDHWVDSDLFTVVMKKYPRWHANMPEAIFPPPSTEES